MKRKRDRVATGRIAPDTGIGRGAVIGSSILAVLLLLGLAVVVGSGRDLQQIKLTSGSAWLASPERGYVTLVDGPSEQVVATVVAPSAGPGMTVTQFGSSALTADNASGQVAMVDGATFNVSAPRKFARPDSQLSVLASGSSAFVIDATARVATVADSSDLGVVRTLSMAARPGSQQTLVDTNGRLWTVDADGTGLSWIDGDGGVGHAPADGSARLVQVQDRVVLVEFGGGKREISWLTSDGGGELWPCDLAARPTDDLQVLGASNSERVFVAVSQTGTMMIADGSGDNCGAVVTFADPDTRIGPLAQNGRFVFVPNRTRGSTTIIDTEARQVVAELPLTEPNHHLELLAKDGQVFYNDLDSEKVGVLQLGDDGIWTVGKSLRKYDPETGAAEQPVVSGNPSVGTQPASTGADTPAPSSPSSVATSLPATATPTEPPTSSAEGPSAPPSRTSTRPQQETVRPLPTTVVDPITTPESTRPPPTPEVVSIAVSPAALTTGITARFTATVNNPSGQWSWSAISNTGDLLGTSNSEDALQVPLPGSGITLVTVTLQVGGSLPRTQNFPVSQILVETTTDLSVSAPPEGIGYWTIDPLTVTVTVTAADGSVPTGEVTLTMNSTSGIAVDRSGENALLVDGQATFSGLIGPKDELNFIASYAGDEAHKESSNGTFIQLWVKPAFLRWSQCVGFTVEVESERGQDVVAVSMEWFDGPGGVIVGSGTFTYQAQIAPNQWEFRYQGTRPAGPAPWTFTITVDDVVTQRSQVFPFTNAGLGGCIG